MKKCLLIVNASAGNATNNKINQKLYDNLSSVYEIVDEIQIAAEKEYFDIASACKGYDALCISGGDGTLNSAINAIRNLDINLLYHPSGTVNDFAHSQKSFKKQKSLDAKSVNLLDAGEINQSLFSYVAATGTFTSIGYTAKSKHKKIFKRLAYWFSTLAKLRVHSIKTKINIDGRLLEDKYTLIMAVKSRFVFGFNFNKLYSPDSGKGHLLLIKTPTGFFKIFKLFCSFFRTFIIGFNKTKDSKHIKFLEFNNISVDFMLEQDFCIDGEKYISFKHNTIKIYKEKLAISII